VPSTQRSGYLVARLGDRVAIAFGGRAFTTQIEGNAIAWIAGRMPDGAGLERLTEAGLFELVDIDPALSAPESVDQPSEIPSPLIAAAGGIAMAAALGLRRMRADRG